MTKIIHVHSLIIIMLGFKFWKIGSRKIFAVVVGDENPSHHVSVVMCGIQILMKKLNH